MFYKPDDAALKSVKCGLNITYLLGMAGNLGKSLSSMGIDRYQGPQIGFEICLK